MRSVNRRLALGKRYREAGDLKRAARICRDILQEAPDHSGCLHMLGLVAHEARNRELALACFSRAVTLNPSEPSHYIALGDTLADSGRTDAALLAYREGLRRDPACSAGWRRLAAAFAGKGANQEAAAAYRQSLDANPASAESLIGFGNFLYRMGMRSQAADAYRDAIKIAGDCAEAHYNLGVLLAEAGDTTAAAEAYGRALRCNPRHAMALNNLSNLRKSEGRRREAIQGYNQAIGIQPGFVEARFNLAVATQQEGKFHDAAAIYRQLLEEHPDHVPSHHNLGLALRELGDLDGAIASYREALRLEPHHSGANWNLGLACLLAGRFEEGWQGYEWRRQRNLRPGHPQPMWTGELLTDRIVLIHPEQGLGDSIQFARYVPLVASTARKVVLACQPSLLRLFGSLDGVAELIPEGREWPPFDCHAPLPSLPGLFGSRLDTVPSNVPYLSVTEESLATWQGKIAELRGGKRFSCGLCWAGNPDHGNDRARSLPPERLATLGGVSDVAWFSLQKGSRALRCLGNRTALEIQDLEPHLHDFAETAAAVANLDLVITVDTAVSHLAGALARPVWTLLPFSPDWRWMLGREDSPWYPTMRLFRQPERGAWEPVIASVKSELQKLVRG